MNGNYQGQGEIIVSMRDVSGRETPVFNVRGRQGGWRKVQRSLKNSKDYEVTTKEVYTVEGEIYRGKYTGGGEGYRGGDGSYLDVIRPAEVRKINDRTTMIELMTVTMIFQVMITIQSSDLYPYNSLIAIDDVSILPRKCSGGPCSSNPCRVSGSTCVEPTSGGYYCLCPEGKAGDRCDRYGK